METRDGKTLDSGLHAIRIERIRAAARQVLGARIAALRRGIRAAVLAVALATALHAGWAGAQTSESEAGERETRGGETAAQASTAEQARDSTEQKADDSTRVPSKAGAPPKAAEPKTGKPPAKASKPFEPSEKIDAESVVSFPSNI